MRDHIIAFLLAVITIAGIELVTMNKAHASITDQHFSANQVFDVQWSIAGSTLTTRNYNYLYASVNASGQLSAARTTAADFAAWNSNGRYLAFYNSPTVAGTFGLAVFNSDGSIYRVLNYTGTFRALADGAIFYNGNGSWGTLFTTSQGYAMGTPGPVSFTVATQNPTNTQMASYTPTTTQPLAAGQSAPVTPVYTSNITPQQQARVNSATNLRNSITQNSIYIEQVGNQNTVTVTQNGRYNMVAGTGAAAAPLQGDYNTITIRQGDPLNSIGKNLIQTSVYGSSNTLNLNQGTDTAGNGNGSDIGGHMQYIIVSGSSNTVTTQQQNSGITTNNYLETNITGNNNSQSFTQTGNATKQVFATTTGNSNTLSSLQDGLGAHYLDVTQNGDSNSAVVSQTGNTRNAATIILTNAGAPASVNLTQTGGQTYNISQSCTTACGTVTVRQGN